MTSEQEPGTAPDFDDRTGEAPEAPEAQSDSEAAEAGSEEAGEQAVSAEDMGSPTPDEARVLREKARERDELFERLQRVTANFQNAQKRQKQESETRIQYALQDFARALLTVVDSFERAIASAERSRDFERLYEGIQLVEKQLQNVLADHGIRPIEAAGQKFDPDIHEAMSVVETEELPESTVVTEFERGYRLNDRLVRPARVMVAKRPERGEEGKDADDSR